jgi:hypothetical protein
MNDRRISNLQWAMSVLEELPTETIEQDRAIDIGISAIQDKIDSLCEQEDIRTAQNTKCGETELLCQMRDMYCKG